MAEIPEKLRESYQKPAIITARGVGWAAPFEIELYRSGNKESLNVLFA